MTLTSFYGNLLYQTDQYPLIKDHLSIIAERMWEGIRANHDFIFQEINNYHPDYLGRAIEELKTLSLTIEDCKTTIANEYSFKNWDVIEQLEDLYDHDFEKAVNFLIGGNLKELKKLIKTNPLLVTKRSKYGHRATLLHYTASNGVEMWRQKSPSNLPEITQFLIHQGADCKATMQVYGGEFTTLTLLKSSVHPFEAGIGEEMINILK
ncbi:hypothetical protein [Aquimarina rubra]|uniref:Ankyrin repeat domain-containing protein n=1 Tax=Aquimarina rubra TaxID=1920033 RepID=A0ABW5LL48_9FLAO